MRSQPSYAAVGCLLPLAMAATPDEWRSRSIYQVLTDRFWRPDNSTEAPCDVTAETYCGGTWKGIEYQLDYITSLGANAIWISPITKNAPNAYHGYSQTDLYALNDNFGTAQDLKDLASALHARDMYLMVDVVINHFGSDEPYPDIPWSTYYPFNSSEYFHPYCTETYSNITSIEECWLSSYLPDVATERTDIQEAYADWIKWLIAEYDIDGLRLDTVEQLDSGALEAFTSASGVYVVGEAFDISTEQYALQVTMSGGGLMNYPLYTVANNTFVNVGEESMAELATAIAANRNDSIDSNLHGVFFENQDMPRIAATNTDTSIAQNSMAFTFLGDGIPIVYYGQEHNLNGGNDPYNRAATWLRQNGALSEASLCDFMSRLNQIRSWAIKKSAGYTTYGTYVLNYSGNQMSIRKDVLRTILTNAGVNQAADTYTTDGAEFSQGDTIVDLISCKTYTADEDGEVTVRIGGGAVVALMEQSLAAGSGICDTEVNIQLA
ncbi:hypothetical protein N0V93_005309 [Gnomoniopsis smithogilvyi]|uniref:alpha-amylase n=1 Tax=Gnomoniopsis smithogilvyi TaxID=1191159 RepID=A0A9W8YT22_9PEZI|nr:hypothetical protein N0V93_005309 [Gnomoniopsis smithogilvyi]